MTVHAALSYREAIQAALADGLRFGGLHAAEGGAVVRTVLVGPEGTVRVESVHATGASVPTIVDLVPAAGWDEREAHDLYGVGFRSSSTIGRSRTGRCPSRARMRIRWPSGRSMPG